MARIGFIGLGTMGAPMAHNLLAAGHSLFFFARRSEVVAEFQAAGATPCASCADVANAANIIVTIVPADEQVEQVIWGPGGLIEGAQAGKLLIDMSTISPQTVRRIGACLVQDGMCMLDAPVSGGPSGARQGTLTILVGGAAEDVRRAKSVLAAMGKRIFHVGPLGAGQTAKLVNQLMAGGIMTLVGEALAVAESAGLDLNQIAEAIAVSSGHSAIFSSRHKFVIEKRFEPGFKTALMRKDIALATSLAHDLGVSTPVASAVLEQYDLAIQRGDAAEDFAAVAKTCKGATT